MEEKHSDLQADAFAPLLRRFRESRQLRQKSLAQAVGFTPTMLNYLESGERRPNRDTILRIADALKLAPGETDQLLIAAGHLPTVYDRTPPLDRDLLTVADILGDEDIPAEERALLRVCIRMVCARWRPEVLDTSKLVGFVIDSDRAPLKGLPVSVTEQSDDT